MALTFSSARSRSVICFASVAMKEASLLGALAEPTPGTCDAAHAKRRGLDGRQRWGVGCRRDGGLRKAEVADREPAFEAGVRRADAVPRGAGPAGPPAENRHLGAIAEARKRLLAGVVRQCRAGRSVSRASNVYVSTDGEDGNADGDGCGRAPRAPRGCHRNLLVAAWVGANRAEAFRARGGLGLRGRKGESGEVTRDETKPP